MRIRKGARVFLLDEHNRVLLFQIEDKWNDLISWITPGGGLEDGETFEVGARRELWEETGIREFELGPHVLTRKAKVYFKGEHILAHEQHYVAWVKQAEVVLDHMMEDEREDYRDHKWWTLDELKAARETFLPPGLPELLEPIVAGKLPEIPVMLQK